MIQLPRPAAVVTRRFQVSCRVLRRPWLSFAVSRLCDRGVAVPGWCVAVRRTRAWVWVGVIGGVCVADWGGERHVARTRVTNDVRGTGASPPVAVLCAH